MNLINMTDKPLLTDRIAMQIHELALLTAGWKVEEVTKFTGISRSQLYDIKRKVKERGFDPKISPVILAVYVQDTIYSGRPGIHVNKKDNVVGKVTRDRFGREKSSRYITSEIQISQSSVVRILKKRGYKKVKPM